MIMLLDNSYITGIVTTRSFDDTFRHIAEPAQPCITLKGLEYLAENSFMAKAKDVLKMAGEII